VTNSFSVQAGVACAGSAGKPMMPPNPRLQRTSSAVPPWPLSRKPFGLARHRRGRKNLNFTGLASAFRITSLIEPCEINLGAVCGKTSTGGFYGQDHSSRFRKY
jgi:hypothetical protein